MVTTLQLRSRNAASTLLLSALGLGMVFVGAAQAATRAPNWVAGVALQRRLARPVNIVWSGNPLRQALGGLSRAEEVAVLIDRRVDPGQKLSLTLEQVPLGAALQEIARRQGLGVCIVGSVAYFGPPQVTSRLRTLAALRAEEVRQLPGAVGRPLLQTKALAWDDFATPRDLLLQLSEQNGLSLRGLERVPHDLWAGADLPPLTLLERLSLIAAQFDLTFQVAEDGKQVTLVPVPEQVGIVRSYEGGQQPDAVAKQYAALAPEAQIKVVGSKVYVKGLLEDHERIASPKPVKPRDPQPQQDLDRLRLQKVTLKDSVGRVLEGIAKQLKLELQIDKAALQRAGISLDERISLSLQDVTVDQLLEEVAKPARLKIHRRGNVVEVGPAER